MGHIRMSKKRNNVPDWCVALSHRLTRRYMPVENAIEEIMLDIETSGDDHAKRKWKRIS